MITCLVTRDRLRKQTRSRHAASGNWPRAIKGLQACPHLDYLLTVTPGSNTMRTLVIASRKGGAGKTTISGHIAVEAERRGAGPVAIVDLDPMGSLAAWWNERNADTPVCAGVGEGGLAGTLQRLERSGIRLTVIDTPPFATTEIASIVRAASLVMVPVVPSPHDLRAIGETIELVETERRPMVFVVNNASTNGRLTVQAVTALSQHGTVAPSVIHARQDFRSTMIKGRTAGEVFPNGKSAAEISELWSYLETRLNKEAQYGAAA
jgi:chromosome partitioning protein